MKKSKKEEYVEIVEKAFFCDYIDHNEKVVGISGDLKSQMAANKSTALKRLVKIFNYKIQNVIPQSL